MKAHEETWRVCDVDSRIVEDARTELVIADLRVPPHEGCDDAARLIAAAPDMARALLRRLSSEVAPCICHLMADNGRCYNCEDRAMLKRAGVLP